MKKPKILRKRYIPYETIDISQDELLLRDNNLLITKWKAIRPKPDICWGISFTFLDDGLKISKFYDSSNNFICWYCDIIDFEYDGQQDCYTIIDLLVDVKVMPDGQIRVLDADELVEAMEKGLITHECGYQSLRKLNKVLETIYEGNFPPEICKSDTF